MASTHATGSMKFEVPRWAVYLIAAVLVLAAAYILGSSLKEQGADPAGTINGGTAEEAGISQDDETLAVAYDLWPGADIDQVSREEAIRLAEKYGQKEYAAFIAEMSDEFASNVVFVRVTDKHNKRFVRALKPTDGGMGVL